MATHYRVRTYQKDKQVGQALKRRQDNRSRIEHIAMCKAMGIDPKDTRNEP